MRIGRHFRSLAGQHEFSTLLPWSEPQVRPPSHGLCSRGSLHTVGSAIDCDTWPLVCAPFVIVSGRRVEDKWGLEIMRGVVRATVHCHVTDMAVHEADHIRSIVVTLF